MARRPLSRPEEASRIVTDLTGTTASTLDELRVTVDLLRRGVTTRRGPHPVHVPAREAAAARLPAPAASLQVAGVHVSLRTEGEPRPPATDAGAGADLTAYRIVPEALTNVTKHAGPGGAVARRDGHPSPGGEGYGLIGMRERARSAGGSGRDTGPGAASKSSPNLPLGSDTMRETGKPGKLGEPGKPEEPEEPGESAKQNESHPA